MIDRLRVDRRPIAGGMCRVVVVTVVVVAALGVGASVSMADTPAEPAAQNETTPPGVYVSSAIAVEEVRTSHTYREALLEEDLERAASPADRERVRRAHMNRLARDASLVSTEWNRTHDRLGSDALSPSAYSVRMTASSARAEAIRDLAHRSADTDAESVRVDRIERELPETVGERDDGDRAGTPASAPESNESDPDVDNRSGNATPAGAWGPDWSSPWWSGTDSWNGSAWSDAEPIPEDRAGTESTPSSSDGDAWQTPPPRFGENRTDHNDTNLSGQADRFHQDDRWGEHAEADWEDEQGDDAWDDPPETPAEREDDQGNDTWDDPPEPPAEREDDKGDDTWDDPPETPAEREDDKGDDAWGDPPETPAEREDDKGDDTWDDPPETPAEREDDQGDDAWDDSSEGPAEREDDQGDDAWDDSSEGPAEDEPRRDESTTETEESDSALEGANDTDEGPGHEEGADSETDSTDDFSGDPPVEELYPEYDDSVNETR